MKIEEVMTYIKNNSLPEQNLCQLQQTRLGFKAKSRLYQPKICLISGKIFQNRRHVLTDETCLLRAQNPVDPRVNTNR